MKTSYIFFLSQNLKKFWQQLLVDKAYFSACGMCRIDRQLLTSVKLGEMHSFTSTFFSTFFLNYSFLFFLHAFFHAFDLCAHYGVFRSCSPAYFTVDETTLCMCDLVVCVCYVCFWLSIRMDVCLNWLIYVHWVFLFALHRIDYTISLYDTPFILFIYLFACDCTCNVIKLFSANSI